LKKIIYVVFSLLFLFLNYSLYSQSNDKVKIYTEKEGNIVVFYADNDYLCPAQFLVEFTTIENLTSDKELPFYGSINTGEKKLKLFSLNITDLSEGWSYKYGYTYYFGAPEFLNYDSSYIYTIPFEHGTKHRVGQGYFGKFSHSDPNSEYSIDFDMDIGTPVIAAREGIVIEVKEDSNVNGTDKSYAKYGNYAIVYHNDGSFAQYVHFKQNGVKVNAGDAVKVGDVIGYSGNTGLSSGPHLHFDVEIPVKMGLKNIAAKFYGTDGKEISLNEGDYYFSFHTDKQPFNAVYGRDVKESDYKDYKKQFNEKDVFNVREEKIDDVVILYVQNGYKNNSTAEFEFTLTNLISTKPDKFKIEVPAKSEIFLLILKTNEKNKAYKYGYKYNYTY